MDNKTAPLRFQKQQPELNDIPTLGKRHVYLGVAKETMDQLAQNIGFSPDEISELKRLYFSEFKGTIR